TSVDQQPSGTTAPPNYSAFTQTTSGEYIANTMSTVVTTGSIFGSGLLGNSTLPLLLAGAGFLGLGLLAFLGGLALGALADSDISISAKRKEDGQQYYDGYDAPGSSYLSYAKRSMEALSPVLESLQKAYETYG
ncbi:unnamed protein product, partial [Meganyctiphanes norvegica]